MFSANSSQVSEDRLYVEDVFSTYLYTGNSSTQTITNGIDLAGKGGLVWTKGRSYAGGDHYLQDTARGTGKPIYSNSTSAQSSFANALTSFNSDGFSIGSLYNMNNSGFTFSSWTFREAPRFFDVVTWTGNGASIRNFTHSLGVAPGLIIVKRTDSSSDWVVYHRSRGASILVLNSAAAGGSPYWDTITNVSSIAFGVGPDDGASGPTSYNINGATYVAYLFAHDTTSDGIIQCGSYTGNGSSTGPTVTLGWEPQWLLVKDATSTWDWRLVDNMRGMPVGSGAPSLFPNLSNAEFTSSLIGFNPTATGFQVAGSHASINNLNDTYIYIAIRRGPMRTPTSGTSVYVPSTASGNITTNFPSDSAIAISRAGGDSFSPYWASRLTGADSLTTSSTAATQAGFFPNAWQSNTQWLAGLSANYVSYNFRRAPSFFDEVCYTGTGVARTINHNLGVAPGIVIVKSRSLSASDWRVNLYNTLGSTTGAILQSSGAAFNDTTAWNSFYPTATLFGVGSINDVNASGETYVAYLFASCPGVSKVGSYTGNGSSQTINCGFAAGARFVMIKRTDSTGDWYVWDSARGIVSGNDPRLSLNTTAAEVTTDDSVDTDSSGFVVNQLSATNINVSSATYIYLAVA